jgi:hypothetical protein
MNEKEIDTRSEPAEETDPMKSKDVVEAVKTGQYCKFCDAEISEVLARLGRHICEPDCHSTDFGPDTGKPDLYMTLPSVVYSQMISEMQDGYCKYCGIDTSDELAYLGVHQCSGD